MFNGLKILVSVALFAGGTLLSEGAWGTVSFPEVITNELDLSYTPGCILCHVDGQVGLGTVQTPFGLAVRLEGLWPNDEESLIVALGQLEATAVDSDDDGVPDIEELRSQTDPNSSGKAPLPQPVYGCWARLGYPHFHTKHERNKGRVSFALLVLGFGAWAVHRRAPKA